MKRFYTSIMALAIAFFGLVANAQYKVEVNSAPHDNWVSGGQNFDPTELATALGTDTASLHQAIVAENIVYRLDGDVKSNTYTGNHNEWWMALDGTPQGYGDEGTSWFVGLSYDEAASDSTLANDVISVYVGQMPGVFSKIYEPSTLKCTILLIVGDKEVSFDVTQNVEAGVPSSLTEPVKELSKLNIVKDYTLELNFVPGSSYEGKTYKTTLDGIYEALGVEQADLDDNIADHVLAQLVKVDSIGEADAAIAVYSPSDELELPESASGGAWFGRYINYDEATDTETPLEISYPMNWGAGPNTFYTQSVALADGEFSIVSGQYPGIFKEGDTESTYLYITVGDKAARVKVQAIVKTPEAVDTEIAGEITISVTAPVDDNYATKTFTVDMEAVAAAIGCSTSDITEFYGYQNGKLYTGNHTQSDQANTGYFFSDSGNVVSWGTDSTACYIGHSVNETVISGTFSIGQMAGHYTSITEPSTITVPIIFWYETKIYIVKVEYTVTPAYVPDEPLDYELMAREGIYKEMTLTDDWQYPTKTPLDLDYIESKIGTKDFKLYTDKATTDSETGETVLAWSDAYSCDPKPGFWYGDVTYENEEGQNVVENAGWGSNSFGVSYSNGELIWFQYPGQRTIGDSYLANLYLVNVETGQYIQYILNVSFVETETPQSEDLGTESDTIVVKPTDIPDAVYTYTFDNNAIAETLGVDAETLTDNVVVYAYKSPLTRQALSMEDTYFGDEEGYSLSESNADDAVFSGCVYVDENGALAVDVDVMDLTFEAESWDKAVIRLAFEANGKRVTKIVVLVSEDSPVVGISSAKAPQGRTSAIFNMGGAAVPNAYGNINIITVDGVTKKVLNK